MLDSNIPGTEYFRWFYDTGVWKHMHYRGVRIAKVPSDLWNYQEIIVERDIQWVIETGTLHGGSALFFADLLVIKGSPGRVISVDFRRAPERIASHEKIDFVIGDSACAETAERVESMLPDDRGPLFMILDSNHTRDHVFDELDCLVPVLRKGDYLVVEDTCVNGHPVRPEFGPGPYEALEEYIARHPGVFIADTARERKFGFTAAPRGYLIKS